MNKLIIIFIAITITINLNSQRNVILIVSDDLGTDYCGFYEDYADTAAMPNIRQLLSKGVRFTNAMSNPLCSPTRCGILTGRYSFRTGVGDAVGGVGTVPLDTSEITIPRILKLYNPAIATANIGKWHLNSQMPTSNLLIPNLVGYDYYAGNFLGAISSYTNWTKITNGISSTCTTYATTETANDAISWIKAQNSNQFFLWLAFNAPHIPLHLPPAGLHSYTSLTGTTIDINNNPKLYFKAALEALDSEIGRLFDSLVVYNKMDSTDIIFIADNGNGMHSAQIANVERAKGSIYQYGVHVPFIISGPSVVNPNRTDSALINTQDLFATVIELFGFTNWQSQIPITTIIDSKSILPIIVNQATEIRPWAFTEIFKDTTDSADGKAMRNFEYKLLSFDDGRQEFYNLYNDTNELNDLLLAPLNSNELINYNYLCNEMTTLVGSGTFCNSIVNVINIKDEFSTIFAYPNPFNSTIYIQSSNESVFQLTNILGEKIYTGKNIELQNFSTLPKGLYFICDIKNIENIVKLIKY